MLNQDLQKGAGDRESNGNNVILHLTFHIVGASNLQ